MLLDTTSRLGEEAESLLQHRCKGFDRKLLYTPGPDYIDRVMAHSDRSPRVQMALQTLFDHGRLDELVWWQTISLATPQTFPILDPVIQPWLPIFGEPMEITLIPHHVYANCHWLLWSYI